MPSETKTTLESSSHPHVTTQHASPQTKSLSSRSPRFFPCHPIHPLLLALGIAPLPVAFAETIVCGPGCVLQTINSSPSLAPSGTGTPTNYDDFRNASLNDNVVRLVNGAPTPYTVFGAVNIADTDPVTGNRVFTEGVAVGSSVYGGFIQYPIYDSSVKLLVKENRVTMSGAGASAYSILGGFVSANLVKEAMAEGNFVTLDEGSIHDISGGRAIVSQNASEAIATGNFVTINGGTINSMIYGGVAEGSCGNCSGFATGNTITIKGGDLNGAHSIFGGYGISDGGSPALTRSTGNTVTITGNPVFNGSTDLYGGRDSDTGFDDNRLNVWNYAGGASLVMKSMQNFQYYNFILPDTLAANGSLVGANSADLTGNGGRYSTIERIALGGNRIIAPGETINLIAATSLMIDARTHASPVTTLAADDHGLETEWVLGLANGNKTLTAFLARLSTTGDLDRPNGYGVTSSASTPVTLEVGGTLNVGGTGFAVDDSALGGATVNIGKLDAPVVALTNTAAWNGTSGVHFGALNLGAGYRFSSNVPKAYTVDAYTITGPATVSGDLNANGSTLNVLIPETMGKGDGPLIDVSGDAHIASAAVQVDMAGSAPALRKGERVTLIQSAALNGAPVNTTSRGHSLLLDYTFDLSWTADTLTATLTDFRTSKSGNSLLESYLVGNAFVTYQGGDFLTDQGIRAARDTAMDKRSHAFAVLGGGKVRHKTGSHVDVKGHTLVTGIATSLGMETGDATLAAFFEYGKGDYDAEHSFTSGKVKGRGDTDYQGVGFLGRIDFDNAVYLEGSLRAGRVTTDYRANFAGQSPQEFRYETKNGYTGLHIGGGKLWKLSEILRLDSYAKLLWTRQGKDRLHLSTGERIEFGAVKSKRVKLGARLDREFTKGLTGFAGIAYDHEFADQARAKSAIHTLDTPKIQGGTGLVELGLTSRPSTRQPLCIDFGVQAYVGKREGMTANVKVNYFF
jgi:hypothetical protein